MLFPMGCATGTLGDVVVGVSSRPSMLMFDRAVDRVPLREFIARYVCALASRIRVPKVFSRTDVWSVSIDALPIYSL